jgi:predicted polyphosphate/ATP-dependent NAD kinase
MGADILKSKGFDFEIIGEIKEQTTAEETKNIAQLMMDKNIELLIFCGGDGTARDIYDTIDLKIPVIAIPSGVKMFSSVFALNPKAAAKMLDTFIKGTDTSEKEVLDINEDAFRQGKLESRLYGFLKVPNVQNLLQAGKQSSKIGITIEQNKHDIAQFVIENMKNDVLYLLGPGTTVKAISEMLNLSKALLGIDVIYNKKIIAKDINEKEILDLLDKHKIAEIIISPIGGQGFIFGRGNKQFTPKVIEKVGINNIKIISTEDKMKGISCLRVDCGNEEVDKKLSGYSKVIIGYNKFLLIEVSC